MDERAVSPVVAKTLAAGLAVLYVAGMTTILLGGLVPDYERAAGEELSERVLATAAQSIETTVPETAGTVETTRSVTLPERIKEEGYRIELANRTLHLNHPDDRLDESISLALPAGTTAKDGVWTSTEPFRTRVSGPASNRTVSIDHESTD